ncbi:putative peptidase membrane zinc metallopeptidase [Thermotoga sp. Mc24]|uniref:zinc metallopeptidase n=1 Tax=Thermotoga sp. Mc24 TaxID=1231241 RepID=UPI000542858E|nr:zinc metallopeptidase [Thermotoga sp. Mc24]KHC91237.1 putative peptidase membrane zinc metallopeptidase [Thermotoga sp. Mc24]
MFFFFEPTFIILIPGIILALWAQARVQSAYNKYSRVRSSLGLTGYELAKRLLENAGIYNVKIEVVSGFLSDHYDPYRKVLRLSPQNFRGVSVASLGVVAHEVGHALQDVEKYPLLALRNLMVPAAVTGSQLAWIIFILGLFFQTPFLIRLGILLFSLVVLFTLITLPVEFNASRRAVKLLETTMLMPEYELKGVKEVLGAAALTYVASSLMAFLQLLRMIALAGLFGDRR